MLRKEDKREDTLFLIIICLFVSLFISSKCLKKWYLSTFIHFKYLFQKYVHFKIRVAEIVCKYADLVLKQEKAYGISSGKKDRSVVWVEKEQKMETRDKMSSGTTEDWVGKLVLSVHQSV